MSTPTCGSLFAGIGGIDLGLERAGFTVAWQVENDPWCQQVLRHHWPTTPLYGDVTTLDPDQLAPVDLIAAGFPCQPVSTAGRRKGTADDRWLWPATARLLRHLRPRLALLENTPGLLTANRGAAFAEVLADLARLGYDTEWEMLPAAAVGAPHLRYRVFIVASLADAEGQPERPGLRPGRPGRLGWGRPRDGSGPHPLAHPGRQPDQPQPAEGPRGEAEDRPPAGNRPASLRAGSGAGLLAPTFLGGRFDPTSRRLDGADPWPTEPDVGRVAHGIPRRVDRLRGLGNAVVPQIAEWIGRQLITTYDLNGDHHR